MAGLLTVKRDALYIALESFTQNGVERFLHDKLHRRYSGDKRSQDLDLLVRRPLADTLEVIGATAEGGGTSL